MRWICGGGILTLLPSYSSLTRCVFIHADSCQGAQHSISVGLLYSPSIKFLWIIVVSTVLVRYCTSVILDKAGAACCSQPPRWSALPRPRT